MKDIIADLDAVGGKIESARKTCTTPVAKNVLHKARSKIASATEFVRQAERLEAGSPARATKATATVDAAAAAKAEEARQAAKLAARTKSAPAAPAAAPKR
jgi:hypothetical protein